MTDKVPFVSEKYEVFEKENLPIVEIKVGGSRKSRRALVDTGCSVGLMLSMDSAKGLDIGNKVNIEPIPILMADGHLLGADAYLTDVEIGTEKHSAEVYVLDTGKVLKTEPSNVKPLLGRGIIDLFTVTFEGQAKRFSFFK